MPALDFLPVKGWLDLPFILLQTQKRIALKSVAKVQCYA